MSFIPHTDEDTAEMLAALGARSVDELFEEIPRDLPAADLELLPEALGEAELMRLMQDRAAQDRPLINFIGAGAYDHHVPAAVWDIATRGEFYSACTPYQGEASQGTLQVIYEYQSMMCGLTGLEVSNASLYDAATALAEAVLMGVRGNRRHTSHRVLVAGTLDRRYRRVVETITALQHVELVDLPVDPASGRLDPAAIETMAKTPFSSLVVQHPNAFGLLEQVDELTDLAHAHNALLIAVVNPMSLAVLRPPGEWGSRGADIAVGDGQPFGIPLSSGGPYFGFMVTTRQLVRQMPGRIVGATRDAAGFRGYVLTLQTREQHIRRARATSNICTNQGLAVTAATVYLALQGEEGLRRIAHRCITRTNQLVEALTALPGVTLLFDGPRFHEAVLTLPQPVAPILETLAARGIGGGFDLSADHPSLGNALLVCATEKRSAADIATYSAALRESLSRNPG